MNYGHLLFQLTQVLLLMSAMALTITVMRTLRQPTFILIAFGMLVLGELVRNIPIAFWGVTGWTSAAYAVAVGGRVIQLIAIMMVIYDFTRKECGHWAWVTFLGLAVLGAAVV